MQTLCEVSAHRDRTSKLMNSQTSWLNDKFNYRKTSIPSSISHSIASLPFLIQGFFFSSLHSLLHSTGYRILPCTAVQSVSHL